MCDDDFMCPTAHYWQTMANMLGSNVDKLQDQLSTMQNLAFALKSITDEWQMLLADEPIMILSKNALAEYDRKTGRNWQDKACFENNH